MISKLIQPVNKLFFYILLYKRYIKEMYSQAITQSCIVFIFLTIFFFNYVSDIEKEEYKSQLERLVDDFFKDVNIDFSPIPEDKKKLVKIMLYGLIDQSENEIETQTKDTANLIDELNDGIVKQSYTLMLIYFLLSLLFLYILYKFGDCFSLSDNIKEGVFILFFIFIVEFSFLNLIAKHYIAANLNNIKKMVAEVIIDYVNNRKQVEKEIKRIK